MGGVLSSMTSRVSRGEVARVCARHGSRCVIAQEAVYPLIRAEESIRPIHYPDRRGKRDTRAEGDPGSNGACRRPPHGGVRAKTAQINLDMRRRERWKTSSGAGEQASARGGQCAVLVT